MAATNPSFEESFFSESGMGRAVFFLRDLSNDTLGRFAEIAADVDDETGVALQPVGTAFIMKAMNDQIIPQQLGSLALAALLVFVITAVTQRSLGLGLASTTPIIITLVVMFGVMGYGRIDLSVITGIMSGLTIGVGIDYAIHYVSLFRQARQRGDVDPATSALRYVATPVLANAMGLAIGFTAMLFSPLQIHVTLSILMWVTMTSSAVLSLTFLPTLLGGRRKRTHAETSQDDGEATAGS
jgi:predicted RND superfamily exporter protein